MEQEVKCQHCKKRLHAGPLETQALLKLTVETVEHQQIMQAKYFCNMKCLGQYCYMES